MKVIFKQIVGQGIVISSSLLISAAPAQAESKPRSSAQCAARQKQMQQLEQAGHLREAKDAALECSQAACGGLVSQQCRTQYQLLQEEIPSVVPTAVDEQGNPLVEVEVRVDGVLLTTRCDGQGVALDPGLHEFSFSAPDRAPSVEKVLIAQGERSRRISTVLRPAANSPAPSADEAAPAAAAAQSSSAGPVAVAAAPPQAVAPASAHAEPRRHVSAWPYVVGGVGVASLGATVALATWGHTDFQLLDRCAPNCRQDSVDHVRHLYIAADVSLGVGVVALGVATWLYFSGPKSAEPRADQAQNQFDLKPAPGGAFATWEHAF